MRSLPFRPFVVLVAGLALVCSAGCMERKVEKPTAAEQQLIVQLTRDPFVRVESLLREEDGWLTVRTAQGSEVILYRLMPANDGGGPLTIRRVDSDQVLPVAWSDDERLGTGPQPRGLAPR